MSSTNTTTGKEVVKELEIPGFIDLYNHHKSGVDQADQLRGELNFMTSSEQLLEQLDEQLATS